MHYIFCFLLLISVTLNCVQTSKALSESPTALSIQLSNLNCPGWSQAASAKSIASIDTSPSLKSNGIIPDDLLKEYAYQYMEELALQRGQRRIIIDAYQFATNAGAYGAYCTARKGSSSYRSLGDASSEDQDSLTLVKDNCFFYLHSTETDDDEAKSAIILLAKQLIAQIDAGKNPQTLYQSHLPSIFYLMPQLERLSGSDKIVMGPVGLKKYFPAPYSANLCPLLLGAIADYKVEFPDRDRLKMLLAQYESPDKARAVFNNYLTVLSNGHKQKHTEELNQSIALFKVGNYFLLCALQNRSIIVINGARHKDSAIDLLHQIHNY